MSDPRPMDPEKIRLVVGGAKALALCVALVMAGWQVSSSVDEFKADTKANVNEAVDAIRKESSDAVGKLREELAPLSLNVALMRQSMDTMKEDVGHLKSNGSGYVTRDQLDARLAPLEARVNVLEKDGK